MREALLWPLTIIGTIYEVVFEAWQFWRYRRR
jgi:hypothetical protein